MLTYRFLPAPTSTRGHCLVLHGLGDSMQGWMPVTQALPVPGLRWGFCNAPTPYYGGYSWYRIPGMTGPDDTEAEQLADLASSRAALEELIAHLIAAEGIDPAALILLGFSQGCAMVLDHALGSDRRYAGVVGISGYLPEPGRFPAAFGSAAEDQRILQTHGRLDPVVPIDMARAGRDHLQGLGIEIDWREYAKEHGVDPEHELADLTAWMDQVLA